MFNVDLFEYLFKFLLVGFLLVGCSFLGGWIGWLVAFVVGWLVFVVFFIGFVGSLTCLLAFLGLIFDWIFLGPVAKTHWIGVGPGGMCWGLNSHDFHITGDGHQPNLSGFRHPL